MYKYADDWESCKCCAAIIIILSYGSGGSTTITQTE